MTNLISSILPKPPRSLHYISADLSVEESIKLMVEKDIGALVVQGNNQIIGILSERDIVRACLKKNLPLQTTSAGEICYRSFIALSSDEPIEKAMKMITSTKRRHLLVIDNDQVIDILSIGDLLFNVLEEKSRTIEHLENYIHT